MTNSHKSSQISTDTIQAYLETEYRIDGDCRFILRINQQSPELLAAHRAYNVHSSAYLTAFNPYSIQNDQKINSERQSELKTIILQRGLKLLPGIGQHPSNEWPGEESFLIFGLTLEDASELGRHFGQNAFVWNAEDATPQLILLR